MHTATDIKALKKTDYIADPEVRDTAHMYRVAELAHRLTKADGLYDDVIKNIYSAAIYHDIGKREIDKTILEKEGPLTAHEKAIINTHPILGAKIGKAMNLTRQSIQYILEHHENFDGTGYPRGLKGEDISLGGRIIKICDVYDALTSDRGYRRALPQPIVWRIMEEEKNTFDPYLYKIFREVIGVES